MRKVQKDSGRSEELRRPKTSFATGEFWLYLLAGIAMVYLDSKGMTVDDLADKGAVFVTKVSVAVDQYKYIILAAIFAIKRSGMKAWQMYLQAKVMIEKMKRAGNDEQISD